MLILASSSMLYPSPVNLGDMADGIETMGERLKRARMVRGLTQQELAASSGVTKGSVSQWENGNIRGMRPDKFLLTCDALKVPPAWLVWGYGPDPLDITNQKRVVVTPQRAALSLPPVTIKKQ